MICIATRDEALGARLKGALGSAVVIKDCATRQPKGDKCGTEAPGAVDSIEAYHAHQAVAARTRFRHLMHCLQPSVIVLDLRFGENLFKVIDDVPKLRNVDSGPAVVVVSPRITPALKREALQLGCYAVISERSRHHVRDVVASVSDAAHARLAGRLSAPPQLCSPRGVTLH